jgi:tight adherence protein B
MNTSPPISELPDYTRYPLMLRDKVLWSLAAGIVLFGTGIVFYKNVPLSLVLAAGGLFYPKVRSTVLKEKRQEELALQFKQGLYSISSALGAGKSLENAFREAANDLKLLYPDPQTYLIRELEIINHQVENGKSIERAFAEFSVRTGIDDILQFSEVLSTCKRTGGNLVSVIRRTTDIITDKLEIQQEISVLIAQKRFESKILAFAPIVVIALLAFSSPDYMAPLYAGPGCILMSCALLVLAFCYWLTHKIMRMKV